MSCKGKLARIEPTAAPPVRGPPWTRVSPADASPYIRNTTKHHQNTTGLETSDANVSRTCSTSGPTPFFTVVLCTFRRWRSTPTTCVRFALHRSSAPHKVMRRGTASVYLNARGLPISYAQATGNPLGAPSIHVRGGRLGRPMASPLEHWWRPVPVDSAALRYDHFVATSCVGSSPNLWIGDNVAALNGGVS